MSIGTKPRRVMIGFPSLDGKTDVHFTFAYGETVRLGCQRGIDIQFGCRAYDSTLPRARNDLLRDMVERGCDDVVFIDSDEEWHPEWVFTLLNHPVECVGAPVIKKTDTEAYNVRSSVVPIPRCPKTGLLMPDGGCGTGFLRLTRKAVEAVRAISEVYTDDTGLENRWVFDTRPVKGKLVSEDYMLMHKLQQVGITPYLDASMTCAHIGTKKWVGDFSAWLAKVEAAAAVPAAKASSQTADSPVKARAGRKRAAARTK
jgi:hypothetical protein